MTARSLLLKDFCVCTEFGIAWLFPWGTVLSEWYSKHLFKGETVWTNQASFKWEIIVLPISVDGYLILSTQLKAFYPPGSSHISGSSQVLAQMSLQRAGGSWYQALIIPPIISPSTHTPPWAINEWNGRRSGKQQRKHNENNGTDIQLSCWGCSVKGWGPRSSNWALPMKRKWYQRFPTSQQKQTSTMWYILDFNCC